MRSAVVAMVLLAPLLSGCHGSPSHPQLTVSPTTSPPESFNGDAALFLAKQVAVHDDGSPIYRIPGTPGQAEGAKRLWQAAKSEGSPNCAPAPCTPWNLVWQNLTGQDYLGLDRSMVAGYTPGPGVNRRYCSEADEQRVPSLPFSNLYASKHSSRPGAPLVVLAAHWDSQMHSDNDVPENRSKPDPGANDGASGVGVLLRLMGELPNSPYEGGADLPVSIGLLFLDGEDGFYDCYPLAGSLWYAAHPIERPDAFVLLDMVGDPGALYPKESYSTRSAPDLQDLLWRHGQASAEGRAHFTNASVAIEDDHLAFIHAGVPSVDLIDAGRPSVFPPQWDTAGDTVDKLDAGMLGLVGGVLLATLKDPALWAAVHASATRTTSA